MACSRQIVATPIWPATVVQARLVRAFFAVETRVTVAAAHRKLDLAFAVARTVANAVADRAILSHVWRRTLTMSKAVTNAIHATRKFLVAWCLAYVSMVVLIVTVGVVGETAVATYLLLSLFIIVAKVARARNIGAVQPVKSIVAEAVTVNTITL